MNQPIVMIHFISNALLHGIQKTTRRHLNRCAGFWDTFLSTPIHKSVENPCLKPNWRCDQVTRLDLVDFLSYNYNEHMAN